MIFANCSEKILSSDVELLTVIDIKIYVVAYMATVRGRKVDLRTRNFGGKGGFQSDDSSLNRLHLT